MTQPDAAGLRVMQPLAAREPLQDPQQWQWGELAIERHHQPAGECQIYLPQHVLCLPLGVSPTERPLATGHTQAGMVHEGECSIYPAGSRQWVRWFAPLDFLFVAFDPVLLNRMIAPSEGPFALQEHLAELYDPLVTQLGVALQRTLAAGALVAAQPYLEALTQALAAHLVQHYTDKPLMILSDVGGLSPKQLRQVTTYIHDRLAARISVGELALFVGMSPYHFTRAFHSASGLAPHQYIMQTRIAAAKDLIQASMLPLGDIAARLGFADQAHFSRTFKRLTGVTPSAYARDLRKNQQTSRKNMQAD